jgi:hopene-associated glycosyltransferase HpnB
VLLAALAAAAAAIWVGILAAPWQPWSTRERLEAMPGDLAGDDAGGDGAGGEPLAGLITVLIPARNEAAVIGQTLAALRAQGGDLRIIVVDDQSTDATAAIARAAGAEVLTGAPLPEGWVGKLWALEQGRRLVETPLTLLVDADIALRPGLVRALLARRREGGGRQLVSLMAVLEMTSGWEKLLIPAFVYFFKLLYPFRLSNGRGRLVAAAAGGCVLVESAALDRIGGFGALRHAIIDDCTLARRVKEAGGRTWVGLTHDAISLRPMSTLGAIWQMVARSAFAQLRYSSLLLVACVLVLAIAFWVPIIAVVAGGPLARWSGVVALAAMGATYVPVLRFYARSPLWVAALPVAGTLYLAMTVSSAIRAWRGVRSSWKGRTYARGATGAVTGSG